MLRHAAEAFVHIANSECKGDLSTLVNKYPCELGAAGQVPTSTGFRYIRMLAELLENNSFVDPQMFPWPYLRY